MGLNLQDYWKLEEHTLGETTLHAFSRRHGAQESHAGQRLRAERDVSPRRHLLQLSRRARHRELRAAASCRQTRFASPATAPECPNGPRTATLEEHTHHKRRHAGQRVRGLPHARRSRLTIANVNVHAHTFEFITPAMTDKYKIPNPCTSCHTDKNTAWATDALRTGRSARPGAWNNWRAGPCCKGLRGMLSYRPVRLSTYCYHWT